MAKWALIIEGRVHETTAEDPAGRFSEEMQWEPCGATVAQGWFYLDGQFSARVVSLEDSKLACVAALTNACAATIVGGYSSDALGSSHIYPSGFTDQINMMGSVTDSLLPDRDPDWSTPFWCEDDGGVWAFRVHAADQIQRAGSDGKAHVVNCQNKLQSLLTEVYVANSVAEIEAISW